MANDFRIKVSGSTDKPNKAIISKISPAIHEMASMLKPMKTPNQLTKWDMRTGSKKVTKEPVIKEWGSKRDKKAWEKELADEKRAEEEANKRAASITKSAKEQSKWQEKQERDNEKAIEREMKAKMAVHKRYMGAILDEQNRIRTMNIQSGKWFKANVSQVHDAIGSMFGWRAYRAAKWITEFMSQWESGNTPDIIRAAGGFGKTGANIQKGFEEKYMGKSPRTGQTVSQDQGAESLAKKGVTRDTMGSAVYSGATGWTSGQGGGQMLGGTGVGGASSGAGVGMASTATTGTTGVATSSGVATGTGAAVGMGALLGPLIIIAGAVLIIAKILQTVAKNSEALKAMQTVVDLTLGSIMDGLLVMGILLADALQLLPVLSPAKVEELLKALPGYVGEQFTASIASVMDILGKVWQGLLDLNDLGCSIREWFQDRLWDFAEWIMGDHLTDSLRSIFTSGEGIARNIKDFLTGDLDLSTFKLTNPFKLSSIFGKISEKAGEVEELNLGNSFKLSGKFSISSIFDSLPGSENFKAMDLDITKSVSLTKFTLSDMFKWEKFDFKLSDYINLEKLNLSDIVDTSTSSTSSATDMGKAIIDYVIPW